MQDERWNNPLYQTEAVNDEGLEGHAYVPGGIKVETSSPMNSHPGTNPEQLLGMSLATCLEATLEAIEKSTAFPTPQRSTSKLPLLAQEPFTNFWFMRKSWSRALTLKQPTSLQRKLKIAAQFQNY